MQGVRILMEKYKRYTIQDESWDDMREAGRFNPMLEITFRDKSGIHTHKIGAGRSDDITVYREHGVTYVLTQNQSLGYIGLEAFESETQTADIFLEHHQIKETIGRENLAPFTIIRRLKEFI
jgi:hypothetical protein